MVKALMAALLVTALCGCEQEPAPVMQPSPALSAYARELLVVGDCKADNESCIRRGVEREARIQGLMAQIEVGERREQILERAREAALQQLQLQGTTEASIEAMRPQIKAAVRKALEER